MAFLLNVAMQDAILAPLALGSLTLLAVPALGCRKPKSSPYQPILDDASDAQNAMPTAHNQRGSVLEILCFVNALVSASGLAYALSEWWRAQSLQAGAAAALMGSSCHTLAWMAAATIIWIKGSARWFLRPWIIVESAVWVLRAALIASSLSSALPLSIECASGV